MSIDDPSGARAAILARLLGAAYREPLPGIRTRDTDGETLTITTRGGRTMRAPLAATALFAEPAADLSVNINGAITREPTEVVALLADGSPHAHRLGTEIGHSVTGLRAARSAARAHPAPAELWRTARNHHPDPSVYFEQLVIDGHPVHPLCRTRIGLDSAEFAPEHHPEVELAMIPIATARVTGVWPWYDRNDHPLLPVHPLQLSLHPPPRAAAGTLTAAPLMALRSLAPTAQPHLHVKTSLDVQLTSARRRVSAAAAHNGPALSHAIARATDLHIQRELGSCSWLADGRPSPH
ncbi:MAG: IucA/IucC family protein, partial [Stackebrandtia sp.]